MESSYLTAATVAFRDALRALGLPADPGVVGDAAALGRRAALLVTADATWGRQLGPLLDLRQIQEALHVGSRQAVHDLVKRRRLLRLTTRAGESVFPACQLDESGRPFPALWRILAAFEGAAKSPWTIASWLVTAQRGLAGATPVEWLRAGRDDAAVVEAARRSAARLGR